MNLINSPQIIDFDDVSSKVLFLAGTIEMGNSRDWQKDVIESIKDYDVVCLNPRRKEAPINDEDLSTQINWELSGLECADVVYLYLAAGSISPISLYELGLLQGYITKRKKIVVYCDENYSRKMNVLITTSNDFWKNENVKVYQNYDQSMTALKILLSS